MSKHIWFVKLVECRPDAHPVSKPVISKHYMSMDAFQMPVTRTCMHTRTHTCTHARTHTHTHKCFTAMLDLVQATRVSQHQKGKTNLDLLEQEIVSGSGISCAICKSAPWPRHITMPASHHWDFYRPDVLLATQPTVSKHWRHFRCLLDVCNTTFVRWYLHMPSWRFKLSKCLLVLLLMLLM